MNEYIVKYQCYLENNALSPYTIDKYIRIVQRFLVWLEQNNKNINNLEESDVSSYREWLIHSGKSAQSINLTLAAIRQFFRFWLPQQPEAIIHLDKVYALLVGIRVQQLPVVPLSQAAVAQLRKAAIALTDAKYKASLELMLSCGLRISEVSTVRLKHLFWPDAKQDGTLKVIGTKQRERIIPLPVAIRQDITRQIERLAKKDEKAFLFQSRSPDNPIQPRSVRKWMARIAQQANVDTHPQVLRYTFAWNYLSSKQGTIADLQSILGHESILSTANYEYLLKKEKIT